VTLGAHTAQEKDAIRTYKQAMTFDESSVAALTGIIWCQLLEGQVCLCLLARACVLVRV
jgi:hypothetical protein